MMTLGRMGIIENQVLIFCPLCQIRWREQVHSKFMFNLKQMLFGGELQDCMQCEKTPLSHSLSLSGVPFGAALDVTHHNILTSCLTSGGEGPANLNVREMSPYSVIMQKVSLPPACSVVSV